MFGAPEEFPTNLALRIEYRIGEREPIMADNHCSVIGDITHGLTNAEKQGERHLKTESAPGCALSSFSTPAPGHSSGGSHLSQGLLDNVSRQGVGGVASLVSSRARR
jgi:hypothetical protein